MIGRCVGSVVVWTTESTHPRIVRWLNPLKTDKLITPQALCGADGHTEMRIGRTPSGSPDFCLWGGAARRPNPALCRVRPVYRPNSAQ